MKTDLSSFSNKDYQPGSLIKRLLWYLVNIIFIHTSIPFPPSFKSWILRLFGAKIGKGLCIKPNVSIKYPWFLEIGDYCWIGEEVWIDNLTQVKIESNVCISQGAMLLTGNHNYKKSSFDLIIGKITLAEGVWIGANSVVCPGVTCGSHAVLSVGSIATHDLEPDTIYQGNPAVPLRKREIAK
jgi:putative colanic acid biosynthesis acetyltransferase WcaF